MILLRSAVGIVGFYSFDFAQLCTDDVWVPSVDLDMYIMTNGLIVPERFALYGEAPRGLISYLSRQSEVLLLLAFGCRF